ncbi:hypothetical protein ACFXPS_41795 [Nocardia sp. NPDC059091]|uniref:hypothetical protein n=1 Tax=unclassified Nocardia TaxID=2637762 RepID=UPI0036767E89
MSDAAVNDAVDRIEKSWMPQGVFGKLDADYGFTDNQIKDALQRLTALSAPDLKEAWRRLTHQGWWNSSMGMENFKDDFLYSVNEAKLADDPKYKDFIAAIKNHAVDAYCDNIAAGPQFGRYGWISSDGNDKKQDPADVTLYRVKGRSPQLDSLLQDTEFVMKWDMKTLGHRNPAAHPDFSLEQFGLKIPDVTGWSKIRDANGDLSKQLTARQDAYVQAHADLANTAYDAAVTGDQLFKDLVEILDRINHQLAYEPKYDPLAIGHDFNQVMENPYGSATYNMQVPVNSMTGTVYQRVIDPKNPYSNEYVLTPDAEQRYYIGPLEKAAADWDAKYAEAAKKFQETPQTAPDPGAGKPDPGAAKPDPGAGKPDPGAAKPDPGAGKPDPGAGKPDPGAGKPDPGAGKPDPGAAKPDPGAGKPDPGAAKPDPGAAKPDPAATTVSTIMDGLTPVNGDQHAGATADSGATTDLGSTSGDQPTAGDQAGIGNNSTDVTPAVSTGGETSQSPNLLNDFFLTQALTSAFSQNRNGFGSPYGNTDPNDRQNQYPGQPTTAQPATVTTPATTTPAPAVTAIGDPKTTPAVTKAKSMVDLSIDGITQQVTSVVHAAVTHEQNYPNGSDARAAYSGTPGENTPSNPWVQVDEPSQLPEGQNTKLRTGDVAQWGNRTALVVVENGTRMIIINTKTVALPDAENPPDSGLGDYGTFNGFFHPTGADLTSALPTTPPASTLSV